MKIEIHPLSAPCLATVWSCGTSASPLRHSYNSLKLLTLALVLSLASCENEESHSRSFRYLEVNGKSEASAIIDGVAIEFDSSVHVRFALNTDIIEITTDGNSSEVWTVNEQPFGIAEGEFHIGEKRYGAVRSGDRVNVAADGVTVNGGARGPLPADQ